jgi:hypothetical protein
MTYLSRSDPGHNALLREHLIIGALVAAKRTIRAECLDEIPCSAVARGSHERCESWRRRRAQGKQSRPLVRQNL